MLHLFGKKEKLTVAACVDGKCIKIENVSDPVFSEKMLGDGFAIVPTSDTIVSPVKGEIVTIFPTKHAVGLKTKNGVEVLLHIGINTVSLNGQGFTALVKTGDKVACGQPLIKVDFVFVKEQGYDLTTMTIFTSGYEEEMNLSCYDKEVKAGMILIG